MCFLAASLVDLPGEQVIGEVRRHFQPAVDVRPVTKLLVRAVFGD
jgi:hypothetical protein